MTKPGQFENTIAAYCFMAALIVCFGFGVDNDFFLGSGVSLALIGWGFIGIAEMQEDHG